MTREEAIKMVQAHKFPRPMEEWQRLNNEAIDMAIEALSQPIVAKHFDIQSGYIYCSPQIAENVKVVVRCKDCRFSEIFQNDSSGVMAMYCRAFTFERMVAEDDYCSYGERREE